MSIRDAAKKVEDLVNEDQTTYRIEEEDEEDNLEPPFVIAV